MADYGGLGGGQSLRDALNAAYPMTGLGEYAAAFPPALGADQSSPPVPLPQPRPLQAPPPSRPPVFYQPPPLGPPGSRPPIFQGPTGPAPTMRPPVFGSVQSPMYPGAPAPTIAGGVSLPIGQQAALQASGRFQPVPQGYPPNYGAQLQYLAQF